MAKIILSGNPLSTNNIYRGNGTRRYMTASARERKEQYQWEAKSQWKQKPRTGDVVVNIILYFGDKIRRDWDNFHKLSQDALEGIVYENDSQIVEAHVFKDYDKNNPRTEIIIL